MIQVERSSVYGHESHIENDHYRYQQNCIVFTSTLHFPALRVFV